MAIFCYTCKWPRKGCQWFQVLSCRSCNLESENSFFCLSYCWYPICPSLWYLCSGCYHFIRPHLLVVFTICSILVCRSDLFYIAYIWGYTLMKFAIVRIKCLKHTLVQICSSLLLVLICLFIFSFKGNDSSRWTYSWARSRGRLQ